ncbi:tRNA pseudouridine(55) synthase TruB [Cryobacterium frigoriphilum]|uniref:tRNA pseudouridine synthase B n=1 Tax=Cryobacterium frigoriphilum TaxID=1259150 RepID=A0A4R8ZZ73_9MICO|nr:tRNA pseudouridine(55) synthase TruB [Cryobacterium frigoriphilum]TFD49019.1 tRNA pseudouridine(55) synthase TruB [Cryobacterium frigoriphilum]
MSADTTRPARTQGTTASGLLLVDKIQGWTSHDAVARTRRLAGTRKVGHAGTLDPMATGLLVLGINNSTRLLTYVVGLDKEYFATIRLGACTTTDDAEGEEIERAPADVVAALTPEAVASGMTALTGAIGQRPSAVSAIKIDGQRAYARVRAGEDVQLPSRPVTVSAFELLDSTEIDGFLDLRVRVDCGSGTYIRALARDLGAALGVGGHLTALRRTRIGPFRIEDARLLDELDVAANLIAPTDAATRLLARLDLTPQQAIDLGHGKRIDVDPALVAAIEARPGRRPRTAGEAGDVGAAGAVVPVAAVAPDGRLVGLVELRGHHAKSVLNFAPDEPAASVAEPNETR